MRFIHCSDLHLDSKLETNLSPARARQRNNELCRTFERMVTYAKEQNVRAILIAGDLFDAHRTKHTTVQFILQTISQARNIDFLYLRGNHDYSGLTACGPLPNNLKLFGTTWTSYRYNDVVISGIESSNESDSRWYDRLILHPSDKNIVMLHGPLSSTADRDKIVLSRLSGKYIDYLALGHLHQYQSGRLDHRGVYCYSGCLEGRGFDECGEKGFVLLETSDFTLRKEFIPFSYRSIHAVEVDISRCNGNSDILSAIRQATAHIPEKDMVKITLTGTYSPQMQKSLSFLESMLNTSFYCIKITDHSKIALQSESFDKDISLKSEFIRRVLHDNSLSEDDVESILQLGLAALRGEELDL